MHLDHETAREWIAGRDRRHERHAPGRAERLAVIADVAGHVLAGVARPAVLDLGGGTEALPARYGPCVRFADAAIGADGWTRGLGSGRPFDAAVGDTALHHLPEPVLARVYEDLHRLLRPGGVLVTADRFPLGAPGLGGVARHVARARAARLRGAREDEWASWWAAVGRDPRCASPLDRGERPVQRHVNGGEGLPVHRHVELLRRAGFAQAAPVWQVGDDCVLTALR